MKKTRGVHLVTVNMGYGHERAAYPLRDLAGGEIITANNYPGIPRRDREAWEGGRTLYEIVSRLKHVPLIGQSIFDIMDDMQRIEPFYPRRDLSRPTLQLRQQEWLIRRGWGKDLITRLNADPRPLITSFPTVAFFAERHGYREAVYCICTDTDVNRSWAPIDAEKTKIHYLVPNRRVKERLMRYGVRETQIIITGFPLPKENIGKNLRILKSSLGCRISLLDPRGVYQKKYQSTIAEHVGAQFCRVPGGKKSRRLTVTFAVGGAGAQREIGVQILESLHRYIDKGQIKLNLVAGVRNDVYRFYEKAITRMHLAPKHRHNIGLVYAESKADYFRIFNETLLDTDVLWTKPSELSFYAGLGLPIIMAPTVGSQEEFNKDWLLSIGAGFKQEDPRYTHEWLMDWLQSGWLAEAAMNGFLNAPRNGAYHIEEVVLRGKRSEIEDVHLL